MSEKRSWMPSDEEIRDAWFTVAPFLRHSTHAILDVTPLRALITTAVEKALAEQRGEWIAALKVANGERKCHPDFTALWEKAEASPDYWAQLLTLSTEAYREQEERHTREVIEARIDVLESVQNVTPCIQYEAHLCDLRAELAALTESSKP